MGGPSIKVLFVQGLRSHESLRFSCAFDSKLGGKQTLFTVFMYSIWMNDLQRLAYGFESAETVLLRNRAAISERLTGDPENTALFAALKEIDDALTRIECGRDAGDHSDQ
jgi:hypothetical protein